VTSLNPDTTLQPRRATFAKRTAGILRQIIAGVTVIRAAVGDVFMRVPGLAAIAVGRFGLAAVMASTTPAPSGPVPITCLSVSAL
jgi:hypothetical protein